MALLKIRRVIQYDGHLRSVGIWVDDLKVGSLKSGQESLEIKLDSGEHLVQAKLSPFYWSIKRLVKLDENEKLDFHVGIFYSNVFQGFMPSALKILSESEYQEIRLLQKKPLPRLPMGKLWMVIISGVLAGMFLIYASRNGNLDSDYQGLISLLGWAAALGGISVYLFNRPISDSSFPYYKPLVDAGAFIFLSVLLGPTEQLFIWSCLSVVLLLVIGGMNLRNARK